MCLQLLIGSSELRFFSAKLVFKILYIVNENLVFEKILKLIDLVLLLDYLQNYTVESFPS